MKKITALFLAILMLMLCLPSAFAAGVTFSMDDATVNYDEVKTISVPIVIGSNPGFSAAGLTVEYDNTYLKATRIRRTFTDDMEFISAYESNPNYTENQATFAYGNGTNIVYNGVFATVEFQVLEGAPNGYEAEVKLLLRELIAQSSENENVSVPLECEEVEAGVLAKSTITITKNEPDPTPEPVPAVVESAGMVDTTDIEGPNPSITSFMTVINTNDEAVDALTWNVTYDGKTNSYAKSYGTTFTGTVKLGLYIENLYVADESLLDVNVELGKGE